MKFRIFLLIYSILSLLLVFPNNALGENLSKDLGGTLEYNIKRKLEEENYILIIYKENADYTSQNFSILYDSIHDMKFNFRKTISKIVYNNNSYEDINFIIEKNKIVELHFSAAVESLQYFFDKDFDSNCDKISYADLSHFDSSALKNSRKMFNGCSSIQEINFTNFNTALVEEMDSMFYYCSQLLSLDLSNFNVQKVNYMDSMFEGCTSLEYLDISNFNPNIDNSDNLKSMFNGLNNIKYINIYNVENEKLKEEIANTNLNIKSDLVICQSKNILDNDNAIYECCDFTKSPLQCDSNDYIIVKYKDAVNYTSGFVIDNCPSRNQISYIINHDWLFKITEPLLIEANSSIEIHFSDNIKSLENFFNGEFDKNSQSIIYIDLSHLNTSLLTNTSKMFHLCASIQEINFINFDSSFIESMSDMFSGCNSLEFFNISNFSTELVTNMSNMFSGCNLIRYLNLSSFNTSNTIDMSGMFYGCDNLEILDISNFDLTKCDSYNNMFSNYDNLKYIDIKNLKTDKILIDSFKNTKLFYVCQSMDLIKNSYAFNYMTLKIMSVIIIFHQQQF